MKLAASNIAWDPADDAAAASLLRRAGFDGVEIAPTKWREQPYEQPPADVAALRAHWNDAGLQIVSLQSLLFGQPDLRLFGDDAARASLTDYLRRAIDFAAALGAHALVFGSPRNRLRGSLPMDDAMRIAADFFRALGPYARDAGCALCIEPNPPAYGCDFVTNTTEAADLCALVDDPGIGFNIDTGAMAMNGERPMAAISLAPGFIRHVHASEPQLVELGAASDHPGTAHALNEIGYDGWVSIEMRAAAKPLRALEHAVALVGEYYGNGRP